MLQSVKLSPDDSIIRWNLAQMLEQECFGGNDEACIDSRNAWKKVIELSRLSEDEHHEKIAIEHLKKLKRLFIENPRQ